jgi:AcrR family transcriptional regulator
MPRARILRRSIGRPRLAPGLNAREQLLDAAVTLFAAQGVGGTTLAQVAAKAGVTTAMVHYYFRDRDRLVDAILKDRVLPIVVGLWSPVVHDTEVPALVRGFVERLFQAIERYPWFPSLWLREILVEGGHLRARLQKRAPVERIRHVITVVKAAQKRGNIDPRLEPRLVIASVIGITLLPLALTTWKKAPGPLRGLTREDIARHAEAILTNAFAKPRRHG